MLWYLRFSRLFGCLFITMLNGKTISTAAVAWKSPYIIYAILWFCIAIVRRVISMLSMVTKPRGSSRDFNHYVMIAFRAFLLPKVFVSYTCVGLGSAKLLDFLQGAAAFEKATLFTLTGQKKSHISRTLFNFVLRTTLRICLVVTLFVAWLRAQRRAPALTYLPVGLEAMNFCGDVAFFFYDFIVYAIITRCSEVLVSYIGYEVKRLQSCHLTETSLALSEQFNSVSTVATVRINVCKINALRACLDDLCGPAMVSSTAALLGNCCIYMYRFIVLRMTQAEIWLSMSYVTYSALCMVDITLISEDLQREGNRYSAIKIWLPPKGQPVQELELKN
ncbi:hypothetical protein HPB50_010231 [Hyalomma asiaticum]|uniref:Uncharacterized protein n=1 Tax=Hyalomma asiaticum TaxID=266040 RepID=A0ACB7RRD3_HYAAI|nr:hypothetical protein HPB50_010231 [Hyalomma asiaticum]